MCPDQDAEPGRIAELGAGHVHHDGGIPRADRIQQYRTEVVCRADIDLSWSGDHGYADDDLNGIAAVRHLYPPPAQDADFAGNQVGLRGGERGRQPEAPDRLTRQP